MDGGIQQVIEVRPETGDGSRRTLIVGLGATGLSCARFLARQGVDVAITDSRSDPPALPAVREELPDLTLYLGGFDKVAFAAAERLIVSPGVSIAHPLIQGALARGVTVMGDVELFARAVDAPVAAITGSNGKSTVTRLLGAMANAAGFRTGVGGNIGKPVLELLDHGHQMYVVELSSFQLETTRSLRARAAVVLNLSPDHMDRYPDVTAYAAAKSRIYGGAECGVFNRDDERVTAMQGLADRELGFTLGEPSGADYGLRKKGEHTWLCRGARRLLPVSELRIVGRHNLANALAALAMGEAMGLPVPAMLEALRRFSGLAHRTQFVTERRGVRWFNDSKATNVGATIAALEGLHPEVGQGRTVLIAGGEAKGADFAPLAPVVARTSRAVILIGRDAQGIEAVLGGLGIPLLRAEDMHQAVALADRQARFGDRVLLSPACASFDMFSGFAQRGEVFTEEIRRLQP